MTCRESASTKGIDDAGSESSVTAQRKCRHRSSSATQTTGVADDGHPRAPSEWLLFSSREQFVADEVFKSLAAADEVGVAVLEEHLGGQGF